MLQLMNRNFEELETRTQQKLEVNLCTLIERKPFLRGKIEDTKLEEFLEKNNDLYAKTTESTLIKTY